MNDSKKFICQHFTTNPSTNSSNMFVHNKEQIHQKNVSRFQNIWSQFCLETTIHGLYHMKHTHCPWKIIWIQILLSLFVLTAYYCGKSGVQYSLRDVKTTMVYEAEKQLQFPAITFCNQFSLTTAGGSIPSILLGYETIFAKELSDMSRLIKQSQKTCKRNVQPFLQNVTFDMSSKDTTKWLKYFTQDSFRNVISCFWQNKEINCKEWFANQLIDSGLCFTFNPNREIAKDVMNSGLAGLSYGLNDSYIEDKVIFNAGQKNGLQFLLNTAQNEHCDISRKYEGAGFRAMVHDPDNLRPFLSIYPSFRLRPGSVVNVLLNPTIFLRSTAHLGRCQKPIYKISDKIFYFINMCIQQCLMKRIIFICQCNAMYANRGWQDYVLASTGINISSYKTCDVLDLKCIMARQYETYQSDNPKRICPECIQPCFETKYEVSITYANFPTNNYMKSFIKKYNISSRNEVRKNYMFVNFFFESLTVLKVYETEAFTIIDMSIYIGGVIGLFMGMSFLTIFEIWQVLSMSFIYEAQKMEEYGANFVGKDRNLRAFRKNTFHLLKKRRNAIQPNKKKCHSLVTTEL